MKQITNIIKGFNFTVVQPGSHKTCTGIAFDSRKVEPGFVFIASKGTQADGHQFIQMAIEKGAVAIVCEDSPAMIPDAITLIVTPDAHLALACMAGNWFDHPSQKLKLTGVTGTNGKTTIATMLYKLFESLGYRCGLLSTVENRIHQKVISATHTTPDPIQLNALLAEMVKAGCDYAFIEVSSHAAVQHRVAGLQFAGGIFTNLTHDHLDYHKTFAEYLKAKKGFFDALPKTAFALINADDKNGGV
ncbi:MAG: UDP-N-acetylmuramoyl-L-alanyl-D-glutamate--2,6-diaminopimelate ligase, partial [Bacteroidetes bacterium HGW-Bacteroidetes-22]